MANEQMGMPAAAPSPEEMAVFDQMRQSVSPKEFSDEMLATASQVDPQAVAEFKKDLEGLDVPPEVLDALNDVVDEILAKPEQYAQLRKQYMEMGLPEDILPEQFDPHFFAALNMAIDQMIAAPAGPQAFAKGGIAELKPIAKALASYGRNGDTMLAHITPAEARMLRRRGGSGTINPDTGLPEFSRLSRAFKSVGKAVSGAFKSIGNAVKKFTSSTVGRLVTTVALGFFLGPAAASALGVSSAAGVAAVSGFVGSAGSTLLGGGSIRDALKAGTIGGLTAGAGAGIMGGSGAFQAGSYTGPTTVSGQWDKLKAAATAAPSPLQQSANALPPSQLPASGQVTAPVQAPLPGAEFPVGDPGAGFEPYNKMFADMPAREPLTPSTVSAQPAAQPTAPPGYNPQQMAAANPADFGAQPPSLMDQAKDFYKTNISPSGIQQAAQPAAQEAGAKAVADLVSRIPDATPAMREAAYQSAVKAASPGLMATYGPSVGLGIAGLGLTGGFKSKPAAVPGAALEMDARRAADRKMMEENPGMFTPKGFERFGAVYNDKGQIVEWRPWTIQSAQSYPGIAGLTAGLGGTAPVRMADGGETRSQDWVNQLVREAAQQAGGTLSYADLMNAGKNVGIAAPQLEAAINATGVITPAYFSANPDVAAAYAQNTYGMTPTEFANTHYQKYGMAEQRQSPTALTYSPSSAPVGAGSAAAELAAMRNQLGTLQSQYDKLSALKSPVPTTTTGTTGSSWGIPTFSPTQPSFRSSLVSTPSVLSGQQVGLSDPFGAGKIDPLKYLIRRPKVDMYGNPIPDDQDVRVLSHGGPVAHFADGGAAAAKASPPSAYVPTASGTWSGGSHIVNGVQLVPGAPGYDFARAAPRLLEIAGYGDTELANYLQQQGVSTAGKMTSRPVARQVTSQVEEPVPTPWNTMPNFTDYQKSAQGTSVVPTKSILGGQVLGLIDPFAAGRINPLKYLARRPRVDMYGNPIPDDQETQPIAVGGIAGLAAGGYPRRTGQIEGPGTETSDEIPAMLSDGEFVMTAKAVRGAGNGSRREGAKKMYALMHRLEKNAAKG